MCNRFPDNKCPFISRRISTVSQHTCNLYRLFAKHRFMIHESKKRIFDEIYGRARLIRGKLWKRANNKCVDAHCLFVGKEKKKSFRISLSISLCFGRGRIAMYDVKYFFPSRGGRSDGKRDSPAPDAINSLLTKQTLNRGPPLRKYSLLYVIKTGIRYGYTEHVDKIN